MRYGLLALMIIAAALTLGAAPTADRLILVQLTQSPSAWNDSRLYDRLVLAMTREQVNRIERIATDAASSGGVREIPNVDSLVNLGRDRAGQYLIYVAVFDERLESRKSFQVPLVFHKWEVFGVIEGELRVIDLLRGKQVYADAFSVELRGPRAVQATMDDTKYDPDIHISAPDKSRFMGRLEDKLVATLLPIIKPLIAKGDRELVVRPEIKKRP